MKSKSILQLASCSGRSGLVSGRNILPPISRLARHGSKSLLCGVVLFTFTLSREARAVTVAVGSVYDESTNATNQVNFQAPGNVMSSAAFTPLVSTAHTDGRGGVIHFDHTTNRVGDSADVNPFDQEVDIPASEVMNISYAGGSKSFTVKSSAEYDIKPFGSLAAISGNGTNSMGIAIAAGPDELASSWKIDLGQITGGSPGEAISTVGFTLLSRNNGLISDSSLDVTVSWFLNGSSSPYSTQLDAINAKSISDNTFFSFTAPTNSYVSGFSVNFGGTAGTDRRLGIDDLGFITSTVPEPSHTLLMGMALAGCLLRRRRSHQP